MRGEDARIGFAEGERQAVKELMRSVPDIFVRAHAQLRHEELAVSLPDSAIDSICADKQVAVCGESAGVSDLRAKIQINAKMPATALQNLQELDARDAGKAVAANRNLTPAMHDVNVVPHLEAIGDLPVRLFVRLFQIRERLV